MRPNCLLACLVRISCRHAVPHVAGAVLRTLSQAWDFVSGHYTHASRSRQYQRRMLLRMELALLAILVLMLRVARPTPTSEQFSYYTDYCIVGAGPAGLQMGYFLHQASRSYVVFERSNISGNFFTQYPRHRTLISINKRSTGRRNREFNERHDWNSLLSDEPSLLFTHYSRDFFPVADDMVRYLNDFQRVLHIKVRFNTEIHDIQRHIDTGMFSMMDQKNNVYICRWVIVATGMWLPINPSFRGHEFVQTYQAVSTNSKDFEGHKVLILGRGNSAFETANRIYGSTSMVHMIGRSRARLAWSTHYVGDLRALNNNLLDTYQLKSLDGLLEASVDGMTIERRHGKLWVRFNDTADMVAVSESDSFALREGYDDVISCLGFKFDISLFHSSTVPAMSRRVAKYPALKATYESQNIPGLFFVGTASHSLDFRRSAGGFIHGFRYTGYSVIRCDGCSTARALHRMLEWRHHGQRWPAQNYHSSQLVNVVVSRINEAAGPYQMFGLLADVILFKNNNSEFSVIPEFPAALLPRLEAMTGLQAPGGVLVFVLEYGPDFSGPGKDTFRPDRATGDPLEAHRSNFLHPVFYFYRHLPTEAAMISNDLLGTGGFLPRPARVHHVLEDFLTQWTAPLTHVLPLRRFLEWCVGADLREFSAEDCFLAELTTRDAPLGCHEYRTQHGWGFSRLDKTTHQHLTGQRETVLD